MDKKLILVSGYCAAGKSTFARRLAQECGVPCFVKDVIKETMADCFDENGENGGDIEAVYRRGSAATFGIMLHVAEMFLAAGQVCVLEGNFKPHEAEALKRLGADCLSFVFVGDLDVLYDRYVARERHSVHLPAGDRKSFAEGQRRMRYGEFGVGKVVRVDCTDFGAVDFDGLVEIAKGFVLK